MAISDELRKLVDPNNECCCEHCLSNKCKEWIILKGLSYTVYYDDSFKNYKCEILEENCNDGINEIGDTFVSSNAIGDTFVSSNEIQAVFSACQWILENKGIE